MLAVERMIVFEHKHRDFGGWERHRFDNDIHSCKCTGAGRRWRRGSAGSRDLSTAHGVTRIDRIPWQNRDVVSLARIQHNLAWQHSCLLGAVGPASAIADVAYCRYPSQHLAIFAGKRSRAALRPDRHVAEVEVGSKGQENSAAHGGCLGGIHIESSVFVNDPGLILRTTGRLSF